jgi:excisionase family DNA binding protein
MNTANAQPAAIAAPKLAYTVEEAAELLRFSRDLAYKEIGRGRLQTYTVGARRFVSHRAVLKYLAEREKEATPHPSTTARGKGRKRQPARSDGAVA